MAAFQAVTKRVATIRSDSASLRNHRGPESSDAVQNIIWQLWKTSKYVVNYLSLSLFFAPLEQQLII